MKPVILIIRDGWGLSPSPRSMAKREGNATLLARTPVQDRLLESCPYSLLTPAGEAVGLPAGQMGNSEVGHLNLGAGRIVYQDLTRISRMIKDGTFFQAPPLTEIMKQAAAAGIRLHLMGLCSDGGVHSHIDHLFALLQMAVRHGLRDVFIHCFTDGRDTSPTSGVDHIAAVKAFILSLGVGRIVSITGRYFAMDRDKRWERTAKAYAALVNMEGVERDDPVDAMRQWYADGKTDEFIPPTVIHNSGIELADQCLRDGDGVIFFNFRSDRARQLTRAITSPTFTGFERGTPKAVHFVCMTEYDETFELPIAFPPHRLTNTLAQVLAARGLTQLRIAETEKYPHVTFFFNGGEEAPVAGEDRCLVPSPKVPTYDLKPEMSAFELTESLIARLNSRKYDVVILNYANPDMVGHTGSIPATIKAVETTDECVGRVLDVLKELNGTALVTADHGNAERMLDEHGHPYTAHTSNQVHLFLVGNGASHLRLRGGILADVAPTILDLLGVMKPLEMTGKSLLSTDERH
jgi:2,3-bisphosphoglycerate-independent phosphoglycerate mutase